MSGSVVATDGPVWGICMARNEADIIATTVAHMLTQVDHVLVADNLSTDDTALLAAEAGADVITDPDPAYRQSQKMTALAKRAAAGGAVWVVPFDADEIWTHPDGRVADHLAGDVTTAVLFDHVTTDLDGDDPDPVARIRWRRTDPNRLPKVACRTADSLVIAMGNHAASYAHEATVTGGLVVHHYPYRSPEQFIVKARQGSAALELTRLPRHAGAHWREYGRILADGGEDALSEHYRRWFHVTDPHADPTLVEDPA